MNRPFSLNCTTFSLSDRFDSTVKPCWNKEAHLRPTFKDLCTAIQIFRGGGAGEQEGYYAADAGSKVGERNMYSSPQERQADAGSKAGARNMYSSPQERQADAGSKAGARNMYSSPQERQADAGSKAGARNMYSSPQERQSQELYAETRR